TTHGFGFGADTADGQAGFQQAVGVVLILDVQIQQHSLTQQHFGQCWEEPGAEAVGIQRRYDYQRRIAALGQVGEQIGFEQGGAFEILQQPLTDFGWPAGAAAYDQGIAQGAFQSAYTLRNRRRRQVQELGGLLETAGPDDSAEGLGLPGVEIHAAVLRLRKNLHSLN